MSDYPWPSGVERLILDEVDSTNNFAAEWGRDGKPSIWVMSHRQSASKGRRGRAWSFHTGNFAASYLTWPNCSQSDMAQMSFVSALALYDAVAVFNGGSDLALKWPNDLLLNNKKLSGILLETVSHQGRLGIVTGIGVNLVHAPESVVLEDRALPAISLNTVVEKPPSPDEFLNVLAAFMSSWQQVWNSQGFDPIRSAWLSRAIGLGQRISARLPNADHIGVFEDIDQNGSLVLRTNTSRLVLPAADVYFSNNSAT